MNVVILFIFFDLRFTVYGLSLKVIRQKSIFFRRNVRCYYVTNRMSCCETNLTNCCKKSGCCSMSRCSWICCLTAHCMRVCCYLTAHCRKGGCYSTEQSSWDDCCLKVCCSWTECLKSWAMRVYCRKEYYMRSCCSRNQTECCNFLDWSMLSWMRQVWSS